MKKFSLSIGIVALGLLCFCAGNVQAAATNCLISTFTIVGLYTPNGPPTIVSNANGTVLAAKITVRSFKITTKDILNLLATEFNTNFPTGAQLALRIGEGSDFVVLDKNGNLLLDVSTNAADSSYMFGMTNNFPVAEAQSGCMVQTHTSTVTNLVEDITMYESDFGLRYADGNGNDFHFSGTLILTENYYEDLNTSEMKLMVGVLSGSGGGYFYNAADDSYDEGVFTKATWQVVGKNLTGF